MYVPTSKLLSLVTLAEWAGHYNPLGTTNFHKLSDLIPYYSNVPVHRYTTKTI